MSSSPEGRRVKQELVVTERVCIKLEAEPTEETERLRVEPGDVPQQAVHVKQEVSCEDSAGLYVDHDIKEELVLGPESLQRSGVALRISGAAERRGERTRTHKLNTTRDVVEINTYMCDICGQLFTQKKILIGHIERHLRDQLDGQIRIGKKVVFCKTCKKEFTQVGHRNQHERTHAAVKPYSCHVCKKKFSRTDTLRQHELIHTGRKPYSCDICDKRFTQTGNLSRHVRIHTGERPHRCGVCSRRFTQSCDLKKHMRIHTGDKPFSCGTCSKLFTCSGDLRTHNRTARHKHAARALGRRRS